MRTRAYPILAFFAGLVAGAGLSGQTGLPAESPFARSGGAARQSTGDESIEFAGMSAMGGKIDLIFFDRTAKRSRWVPLGETVAGITAISYDEQREQAVVAIHGVRKVMALRKAKTVHGESPAGRGIHPAPTALAPPAVASTPGDAQPVLTVIPDSATSDPMPPAPETSLTALPGGMARGMPAEAGEPALSENAKAEREARMLVSDLLEIGVAQRKAYEEAQRKAAKSAGTGPGN